MVPVVFTVSVPDNAAQAFSCGAYILPAQGAAYFLDGTAREDVPVQCLKVLAVRLKRNGTEPPDIIVTGQDSLTSHSWQQDYILHRRKDQPYTLSVDLKEAPE